MFSRFSVDNIILVNPTKSRNAAYIFLPHNVMGVTTGNLETLPQKPIFAHWSTTTMGWVLFSEQVWGKEIELNSNFCRGWQSAMGRSWVRCQLPPCPCPCPRPPRRRWTSSRPPPPSSPPSLASGATSSSCGSTTSSPKASLVYPQPLSQPWRESTSGEFVSMRPTFSCLFIYLAPEKVSNYFLK